MRVGWKGDDRGGEEVQVGEATLCVCIKNCYLSSCAVRGGENRLVTLKTWPGHR